MPLIPEKLFNEEWVANANFRNQMSRWTGLYNYYDPDHVPPKADLASAKKALAKLRSVLVVNQRQMHKALRPWDLTPRAMEHLDRAEPWWGFEFETGWVSAAARGEALAFTFDKLDGAMYDGEGEGGYPVEITFLPEERSKYLNGTSTAHKFIQWMNDNPKLVQFTGHNNVGTHLNMSHPGITDYGTVVELTKFLNRTLMYTVKVNGQRKEMFGRESIYAGFFAQDAGGNVWTEFKGFRTAYTMAEFERYIKTSEALQKCVEVFVNAPSGSLSSKAVDNLYDVAFNGAEPNVVRHTTIVPPAGAERLCTRGHFGAL